MADWQYCPICGAPLEPFEDDEQRTRSGCSAEDCTFVHYNNPTPVVAAIVQYGNDVILARSVGWPDDWFGLVAGFLEEGEAPQAGIIREVREELGVRGDVQDFVGHYPFEQMNQIILAYHVQIHDEPSAGAELAAIKPVPIDEVTPWPMGTGPALRDWLARRKT